MAETEHPLLLKADGEENQLAKKTWVETKKLWNIVGPAIFSRVTTYSMLVITQAFAGHLGDLELAGISIANNVIVGLDFGLLLGMASALETLCGQAYGAKKYYMLGVYLQRSWIVLFLCCFLLLPLHLFASPFLKLLGQPDDVSEVSGIASISMIPLLFSFAFQLPLQRFLQSQLKNRVIAWISLLALIVHIVISWLFVYQWQLGVVGIVMTQNFSWWVLVFGCLAYTVWGGCPLTWTGFSMEAFSGLWDFAKLSAASGVMLCLENWYFKILILMTGNLKNAEIAVDALSICMTINSWELMIPFAFFAGIGVRVANELGAGNGKGAKFATIVAVVQSMIIGFFFWLLIILYNDRIGWIFTNSEPVLTAVNQLSILLAFTVLLNSVQPILSGVAVGSGWQKYVAYINLGCYYLIGVPLGFVMGWGFDLGVKGIWAGMIFGGTATQTVILAIITIRCDWEKEKNRETAEDGGRLAMAETEHPLLLKDESFSVGGENQLAKKTWVETKKLWNIVGPAIFSRVTSYSMLVITQAFAGHLGDLELAGISIANNVLLGFDVGLLLGMASALETLCGQAYGAKKYYMLGVYMQRSWIVLFLYCILLLPLYLFASPFLKLMGQPDDVSEVSGIAAIKNRETAEDGGGGRLAMAETEHPLLLKDESFSDGGENQLAKKTWVETKKLWNIVGPAIFSRVTSYSMLVITQAFAGHLGDLELAGISIANNVIVGFDFGLLLGMASALETLCGQAYGAKKYYMLGVYMQRSWIVLFLCCILLLPLYLFASPFLKLMGQPDDVAEVSGIAAMCMIPLHFSFAFQFPLQRFLQSQLKNQVIAWMSLVALIVHIAVSWLFVYQLQLGVIGTAMTLNFSWWVLVFGCFGYTVWGGCPLTWTGFSMEAFVGLWDFTKLSAASGVML
ncbi:Protein DETOXIFICATION 27 [Linum perenne]